MTDHHLHIGQFNEVYYDPLEVFNVIESVSSLTGITEGHYSSTSSCRDDVELSKIEEETKYAERFTSDVLKIRPYLWFVPKYAEESISVKSALESFDYCGIKLHPFAQKWIFDNKKHRKALDDLFEIASIKQNDFSILIHCGFGKECRPSRFEEFFRNYPDANVILAHSNPACETLEMLKKYKNVKCDIACTKSDNIQIVLSSGFKDKVLFGTDFPITHWYEHYGEQNFPADEKSLTESYGRTLAQYKKIAKQFFY